MVGATGYISSQPIVSPPPLPAESPFSVFSSFDAVAPSLPSLLKQSSRNPICYYMLDGTTFTNLFLRVKFRFRSPFFPTSFNGNGQSGRRGPSLDRDRPRRRQERQLVALGGERLVWHRARRAEAALQGLGPDRHRRPENHSQGDLGDFWRLHRGAAKG